MPSHAGENFRSPAGPGLQMLCSIVFQEILKPYLGGVKLGNDGNAYAMLLNVCNCVHNLAYMRVVCVFVYIDGVCMCGSACH